MSKFVVLFVALMENGFLRKVGLSKLISIFLRLVFALQVSPGVRIGKNVVFGYGGLGTVIHGGVVLGDSVVICQNVTLGGNFGKGGVPTIGEGVFIGPGAKILGPVEIGCHAVVGANSVVTKSLEGNAVYAGNPVKKIRDFFDD